MIDTRFSYQRAGYTETECDHCYGDILESEKRWVTKNGEIHCESCWVPEPNGTKL
jgi:formylmethanofuran dehydrogenase subunit E